MKHKETVRIHPNTTKARVFYAHFIQFPLNEHKKKGKSKNTLFSRNS